MQNIDILSLNPALQLVTLAKRVLLGQNISSSLLEIQIARVCFWIPMLSAKHSTTTAFKPQHSNLSVATFTPVFLWSTIIINITSISIRNWIIWILKRKQGNSSSDGTQISFFHWWSHRGRLSIEILLFYMIFVALWAHVLVFDTAIKATALCAHWRLHVHVDFLLDLLFGSCSSVWSRGLFFLLLWELWVSICLYRGRVAVVDWGSLPFGLVFLFPVGKRISSPHSIILVFLEASFLLSLYSRSFQFKQFLSFSLSDVFCFPSCIFLHCILYASNIILKKKCNIIFKMIWNLIPRQVLGFLSLLENFNMSQCSFCDQY